jgi:hypothetical protein
MFKRFVFVLAAMALLLCVVYDNQNGSVVTITRKAGTPSSSNPPRAVPRRALLNESVLAFMHVAKTGGTSFNKALISKPLSNVLDLKPNCGYFNTCCILSATELARKLDSSLQNNCSHITYEAGWPFWTELLKKRPDAIVLTLFRSPLSHSLSMLGMDLRLQRIQHYGEKILSPDPHAMDYQVLDPAYTLDNMVHKNWGTQNTSFIGHALEHQVFWFGILEHMDASMCLLLWQLHLFDEIFCKSLCHNSSNSNAQGYTPPHLLKATGMAEKETISQFEFKTIQRRAAKDQILYEHALVLFHERARYIEAQVDFRFLNCHIAEE